MTPRDQAANQSQPQDLITSNRSEIWSPISQWVKKATKSTNEAYLTFLEQRKPQSLKNGL